MPGDASEPVDIEAGHAAIREAARASCREGGRVLGLGGDLVDLHSCGPQSRAHGPLSLLQLDAHTDTWDSYFGEKVTHGTIFRRAAEEGAIDASRSVQIGLRGSLYGADGLAENRALGFTTLLARDFDARALRERPGPSARRSALPVYVTVEYRTFSTPPCSLGHGTPEAGGLTSRELLAIVRGLAGLDVVAADVVEVAPPYDPAGATAIAASNVAYELIGLMALAAISGRG